MLFSLFKTYHLFQSFFLNLLFLFVKTFFIFFFLKNAMLKQDLWDVAVYISISPSSRVMSDLKVARYTSQLIWLV